MLNGSPTDNNATLFKQGYEAVINENGYEVVADQAVPDWDNTQAGTIFEQMYAETSGGIDGVAAANDGLGGAAISVLARNGVAGTVPVTGQDATDEGLQRVLLGTQCMSVYKAVKKEADAAAELAIHLINGDTDAADALASGTTEDTELGTDVPSVLLEPEAIYPDNVATVVEDDVHDRGAALHHSGTPGQVHGVRRLVVERRVRGTAVQPRGRSCLAHRPAPQYPTDLQRGNMSVHTEASSTAAVVDQDRPLLSLRKVSKHFGAVQVLKDVDFDAYPGQVTALVGDNGAGKSTLIKSVAGIYAFDEGEYLFEGEPVSVHDPKHANALGIEVVYQDLALCDNLDVVANMYLGRESKNGIVLDESTMEHQARPRRCKGCLCARSSRSGRTSRACPVGSGRPSPSHEPCSGTASSSSSTSRPPPWVWRRPSRCSTSCADSRTTGSASC